MNLTAEQVEAWRERWRERYHMAQEPIALKAWLELNEIAHLALQALRGGEPVLAGYVREWEGDDSDLGNMLYCAEAEDRDEPVERWHQVYYLDEPPQGAKLAWNDDPNHLAANHRTDNRANQGEPAAPAEQRPYVLSTAEQEILHQTLLKSAISAGHPEPGGSELADELEPNIGPIEWVLVPLDPPDVAVARLSGDNRERLYKQVVLSAALRARSLELTAWSCSKEANNQPRCTEWCRDPDSCVAALRAASAPAGPVAWLKEWDGGARRVDLTPAVEAWLKLRNPTVTPLYALPGDLDA